MSYLKISVFVGAVICGGCVPSLHPFFTENDLIFDPAILGQWHDNEDIWDFTRENDRAYRLAYKNSSGSGHFVIHLLQIGDRRFMDVFPDDDERSKLNDWYQNHLVPTHTILTVDFVDQNLRLAAMEPEWIEKYLTENPNSLRHEKVEDAVVLTASTQDLQQFVVAHLDEAFGEVSTLTRSVPGT